MRQRALGSSRVTLPVVGQGTWDMEKADPHEATCALLAGVDAGMTHVDTAEMYGSGRVEEWLGKALAGRRDEVFLASKVLPTNASRRGTITACERSLRRLHTDHLDLYLLHWPGSHPLADTLAAFEELRAAGKVHHYGVSNFDANELGEAVRLAPAGRIACNQVLYHLEERSIEHRVLPACRELGVTLVAYSPFGSGRFPGPRTKGRKVLSEIAERRSVSVHAIALAFLLRLEGVVAIPKAAKADHVLANAAAGDLELTPDEIARIDAAFPLGPEPASLPTI